MNLENKKKNNRTVRRISRLLLAGMLMAVMVMIPFGNDYAYAGSVDSLSDTEKNSSYGFFVWLSENADTADERTDAMIATQILTNTVSSSYQSIVFNQGNVSASNSLGTNIDDLIAATDLGQAGDATSLDALRESIAFAELGNEYRAKENLAPLKISAALMAMAELNVNVQGEYGLWTNLVKQGYAEGQEGPAWGHTLVFSPLDNLARRGSSGYGAEQSLDKYDPYSGWYTEEKENFDTNNGKQTGHYKTLTDRQGTMLLTGFGTRKRVDGSWYYKYFNQTYSSKSYMYDIGNGVTPEKFVTYLNDYCCSTFGHQWDEGKVTLEPTCTEEGEKFFTCTVCGDTKTEAMDPLGHDLSKTAAVQPTCTEKGNTAYYTCNRCWYYFSDAAGKNEIEKDSWIVKAKGHTWKTEYTVDEDSTCTAEGTESIHCEECNVIKEGSERAVAMKPHTYGDWKVEKEPTCTEEGLQAKACTVCGDRQEEVLEKLPHSWKTEYTVDEDSTCTAEGTESIHCKDCNIIKEGSERTIAMKPHTYGEWKVEKEPTCTEKGLKARACTECGDRQEEVLEKLPHSWKTEYTVDEDSTCTAEGTESIHCKDCNVIKEGSERTIAMKPHTYGEWEILTEPTYDAEGLRKHVCVDCQHEEEEVMPVLQRVSLEDVTITVPSKTYTGKALKPTVKAVYDGNVLEEGKDYEVVFSNNVKAGKGKATLTGIEGYEGTVEKTFTINKASNTLAAKGKTVKVKFAKLKKKNQSIGVKTAFAVTKPQGKVTYKVTTYDKKAKKKITVSSSGKVTVKKGLKKGTYKVKVKVSAAGNSNYKAGSRTATLTVKVK